MRIYIILFTSLLIGACSHHLVPAPQPKQLPSEIGLQASPAPIPTQADKMISIATADLVSRFSMDSKEVHLLSAEAQVWPDTSLGCPRPGEVYTRKTVPGYQLRLEAKGQEYDYHTDTDQTVILCIQEGLPSFPVTPDQINDGKPWMPVN
jgi:hypothetical protein